MESMTWTHRHLIDSKHEKKETKNSLSPIGSWPVKALNGRKFNISYTSEINREKRTHKITRRNRNFSYTSSGRHHVVSIAKTHLPETKWKKEWTNINKVFRVDDMLPILRLLWSAHIQIRPLLILTAVRPLASIETNSETDNTQRKFIK